MRKELLIYGVSVGLNRGAILVLMPILLHILSVQDFGLYSYVQLLFQLLSPILSLNIIVAISREGADNPAKGLYLYQKSLRPLILIIAAISLGTWVLTNVNVSIIYTWIILLAGIEAWHNMMLNVFRTLEKNWVFFVFSVSKTLGLLLIYVVYYHFTASKILNDYLLLQLIWFSCIGIIYHLTIVRYNIEKYIISFSEAVKFSIILIPHSIALWLIASSGRFLLKELLGDYELGQYSKVFNVAMVLMIINSGIGIVIPQQIIKNYDEWIGSRLRPKFLFYYSLLTALLYCILICCIVIDSFYFKILKIDIELFLFDFLIIYLGFYLLGYYYIYSNLLFTLRKNKQLSIITSLVAVFSIIINYVLITKLEMFGASISIFLTYLIYSAITYIYSRKYEKKLKGIAKDLLIMVCALLVLTTITLITSLFI